MPKKTKPKPEPTPTDCPGCGRELVWHESRRGYCTHCPEVCVKAGRDFALPENAVQPAKYMVRNFGAALRRLEEIEEHHGNV